MLGDIRGDIAVPPRALIRALQTDSDLYVVQAALRSFEKVTGYRAAGIFDSSVAVAWWKGNEERFAKRN